MRARPRRTRAPAGTSRSPAGFLITLGAAFGYAAGWNPYAVGLHPLPAPRDDGRAGRPLRRAGRLRLLRACSRSPAAAVGRPPGRRPAATRRVVHRPAADLARQAHPARDLPRRRSRANVLNIYSGAMSFMALGLRAADCTAPGPSSRVVFGVIGLRASPRSACTTPATTTRTSCWSSPTGSRPGSASCFVDRLLRRGQPTRVRSPRTAATRTGPARSRCWSGGRLDLAVLQPDQVRRPGAERTSRRRATSPSRSASCIAAVLYAALVQALPAPIGRRPRRPRPPPSDLDEPTRPRLARPSRSRRPGPDWPRAASRSAARCSARTARCSAAATTGGCRTTTRRCTARPTPFRNAGRQRTYRGTTMVTTLSPCWYCSGLVRQFGISARRDRRGANVLRRPRVAGRERRRDRAARRPGLHRHDDPVHAANPALWYEDIGAE